MFLFLTGFGSFLLAVEFSMPMFKDVTSPKHTIYAFIDLNKKRIQTCIGLFVAISLMANILMLLRLIESEGSLMRIISLAAIVRDRIVSGEVNLASFYGYFSALSLAAIVLSGIYAGRYGVFKFFSLISFIPVFLFAFIYMGRANLIWAVQLFVNGYILVYFLSGKELFTRKRILIYLFTAIALLYTINIVSYLRGGGVIRLYYSDYIIGEEPENPFIRLLYSNYVHLVGSVPGFDAFLNRVDTPILLGGKTFRPLAVFADKEHKIAYYPFTYVPMPVNIYTLFADIYMDFGYPGIFFVPFCLGFIMMRIYSSLLRSFAFNAITATIILFTFFQFSIFYSILSYGSIWISFAALVLLNFVLEQPDEQSVETVE